jgi:hypothetical protein
MKHNAATYSVKIILKIVWDFVYFPLWWYSEGLLKTIKGILYFWREQEASLGFFVWLKNIFVPMYGQQDFSGRAISFFIRLVQIIFRGFVLLFFIILGLLFLAVYLALPLALLLAIAFQIF